jgi:hypothetical protein
MKRKMQNTYTRNTFIRWVNPIPDNLFEKRTLTLSPEDDANISPATEFTSLCTGLDKK